MRRKRRQSYSPALTVDDGSHDGARNLDPKEAPSDGWARDAELGTMQRGAQIAAAPTIERSPDEAARGCGDRAMMPPPAPLSAPPFAAADTQSASLSSASLSSVSSPYCDAPSSAQLSLYMVADREYQEFLLSGRRENRGGRGLCGTDCGGDDVGRCCAGFSLVAIAFLLFVGILIEKQPMYVKGLKLKQVGGYTSSREGSQRTREALTNAAGNSQRASREMPWRYRGSKKYFEERTKYEMRKESANAFKASAAYFLTMVLSLIYAQNHDGINASVLPRIARTPLYIHDSVKSVYLRYRRRHYVDIPDTGSAPLPANIFREAREGVPIERKRTFELLRRKVMEMSVKISHVTPRGRRRDVKTKHV